MKRSTALRFISILLLILLISSFFLLAACNSGAINPPEEEETEEETEEEEILEVIKNGKFDQYNDTSTTSFPVTPKNWSYSADSYAGSSAPVTYSDYILYGTISVKENFYNADPKKYKTNSMKNNSKEALSNPGSPFYDSTKEIGEDNNDKILMLQNIKPTAAKYKSSSISVPINSYAIISVRVNTTLINEDGDSFSTGLKPGQGAVISITGGVDKPVTIYGIETSGDWKEYQFIIEGSSVSDKSVTLELGLGTGSPASSEGYTEGFAFFAEAEMKYINKKSFDKYNNGTDVSNSDINIIKESENGKPLRYEGTNYGSLKIKDSYDADKTARVSYTFKNNALNAPSIDDFNSSMILGNPVAGDFTTYEDKTLEYINNNASSKIKDDLKNFPFTNENLTILQKNSNIKASIGIAKQDLLTVKEGEYYRISFWAKTSELDWSGLNVYLINTSYSGGGILPSGNYKNISNINTTAYKLTKEENEKVTNANRHDGWRQYSFFVDGGIFERNFDNTTEKNLSLEIWFGSVNINYLINDTGAVADPGRSLSGFNKATDFPQENSYAMITNIEVEQLSRTIFNSASSAENSITGINLSNKTTTSAISNGSFNNVKASDADVTDKPMMPENFAGMYRNGAPQGNVYGGIVNTNFEVNYSPAAPWLNPFINAIDVLKAFEGDNWNSLLMIYNQIPTAYGYASDYISLGSNTYTQISVSVKTMGSAKASVYLVDREGNRLENYILDKFGDRVSGNDLTKDKGSVYNPYYEEKYDKESSKYKQDSEYENSDENKLLRKGTKYVIASTIPVENPFYNKDYNKKEADKDKAPTWKKETTQYFIYDRDYCIKELSGINNENDKLYTIIPEDSYTGFSYSKTADFTDITTGNASADFVTYTFLIKTGNSTKDIRIELWNGEKYSQINSEGAVFFDWAARTSLTIEEFYGYVLNSGKFYEGSDPIAHDTSMFFDMSGYDNIADPSASSSNDGSDGSTDTTPWEFPWSALLVILPTCAMLIALAIVMVRKHTKNKKEVEQTVTEAPAYARQKNSYKKPSEKDNKNKKFE